MVFGLSLTGFAQSGKIRGTVYEDATGETLIGVTVYIKGTTNGAVTDFDGKFEINTQPGTYDVQVSFVSYETITITGVEVKSGEVTLLENISLKESVEELEEVIITAEVIKDSESALLTVKRKSANLMDGISAAKFKKIGDSDAAGAVKRVTGVSVEGGKYVYVRGLGDRYTKTMLNAVDIPGLDPDRNSLQIDIFPTNLIQNMVVLKSSLAEMPADFTGGVVNIETKDFPEERVFDVSASIGYNPAMHFNSDFVSYEGSSTDVLGFDNGARELPLNARGSQIPSPIGNYPNQEVNDFVSSFNPNLGTTNQTSPMNFSLGLSLADQLSTRNDNKIGYIFSATYKNNTRFYDDVFFGEYQRPAQSNQYDMITAVTQEGVMSENNVLLGGLAGIAYKTRNSKLKLTLMHLQNGEKKAANFFIVDDPTSNAVGKSGYEGFSDNIEYSQRGLTNILLNGKHYNSDGTWEIDWRVSPTFSKITDPDIRRTAFTWLANDTTFVAGAAGNPSRIWRYLDEVNLVGKVDVTREYQFNGEQAKFKFGVSHVYKQRDYEILTYDLQFFGSQPEYNNNPQNVLTPDNIFPLGSIYYATGNNDPNPNSYNSNVNNLGLYVSNEFTAFTGLKATVGLRGEKYVQRHTGRDAIYAQGDTENGNNLDNEKVLDAFDLFPSANFIYSLTENQNLRASYSRTIARPSFKELSFAQILDPITNRQFNGGLFAYSGWDGNLTETRINNFDLRWELFMKRGQLISISAFYKTFDRPIELVRIPQQQTITELQPRNVGDGTVYGTEIELRKSLDFIAPALSKFSLSGNLTLVESQIDMTDLEFVARQNFEKEGESIQNTRAMAGQAPYIINGGIQYENAEKGFDAGFFYNVKGETLIVVGGGLYPDVYSEPFHSLNFNLNKSFGPGQRSSVNFGVSNILNDVREEFFTSFQASDQLFGRYNPGVEISLGLKYSF